MQNDKDSLPYLLRLKDSYNNRYEEKPTKPQKAAEAMQAQVAKAAERYLGVREYRLEQFKLRQG